MAMGSRTKIKIIGIGLVGIGLGLALWGYQLSGSVGSDIEKAIAYYITGAVSFIVGIYLIINKLIQFWDNLQSSFWFLPFLIVLSSVVYAVVLIQADYAGVDRWLAQWPRIFGVEADGASDMLSTLASSMMSVMGIMFSMTLLALSLASSQYTSRILRNFMHSHVTQVTLGTFAGIFVYCLIVMHAIRTGDVPFVPNLAVFFAFVLVFGGIAVLIFFIHHIASSIQTSSIIASVTHETNASIDRLFPEKREFAADEAKDEENERLLPSLDERTWYPVPAEASGYIQNIDHDAILRLARDGRTIVRMGHGIGTFVVKDTTLVSLALTYPLDQEIIAALNGAYSIDRHRAVEQDTAFGIRQIVDMALKALSPSVNDISTAVMCVDYLTEILTSLVCRTFPTPHRYEGETLRVIDIVPTFESMLAEAFDQIRGSATGNVTIMVHMLGAIRTIASLTVSPSQLLALEEHVQYIADLADRTIESKHDRVQFTRRLSEVREALKAEPSLCALRKRRNSAMRPNRKMPRNSRLTNFSVLATVQSLKTQLFCGTAEFTSQWLSAMRFEFVAYIESLVGKYPSRKRNLAVPSESVSVKRLPRSCRNLFLRAVLLGSVCCVQTVTVMAQEPDGEAQKLTTPAKEELSLAPAKVDVKPLAHDEEIRKRLQRVLDATDWFLDPQVRVEEGVVFLNGKVESDELKKWAGDLAHNTQDVVAVANGLQVTQQSVWDFSQPWSGIMLLWHDFFRALPFLVLALLILTLTVGSALLTIRGVHALLRPRIRTKLLQTVIARTAGGFVVLCGIYLILRVSGLTQLALTLVGGTGLIGLIVGIAFRDITENFLSSIFLSIQPPFETGDLVEISGVTGYVQQLNMRTTILMTLDGNLVQIPNSNVYKSTLSNFTTNANRREDFVVGIGYDDAINEAQEIALEVLMNHPAVLSDPEPAVLADSLGASTANLRVYFWLNGREHSWLKVRSSVIRLVKRAFQEHGISMPDEAREVIFPQGIPITMLEGKPAEAHAATQGKRFSAEARHAELDVVSTQAEAGLYSEATAIEEQARQAQPLKKGENLLPDASATVAENQKK